MGSFAPVNNQKLNNIEERKEYSRKNN